MKEAFEKIKEGLEENSVVTMHFDGKPTVQCVDLGKALSIVSEVEAEYSNGWIPCSERLPEEPEENSEFDGNPVEVYLVSLKGTKYPWRAFWTGKNFTDGWSIVNPEAWMPVPEPYKPET